MENFFFLISKPPGAFIRENTVVEFIVTPRYLLLTVLGNPLQNFSGMKHPNNSVCFDFFLSYGGIVSIPSVSDDGESALAIYRYAGSLCIQ